jgi:D-alanyl-D-alanine carboxypeptidase/D-alanyl-D-alanine-endopeptidase (penicillin-binding protein 4)
MVVRAPGAIIPRIPTHRYRPGLNLFIVLVVLAAAACHATGPVRLKPDTNATAPRTDGLQRATDALRRDIDALLDAPALEHSYWGVVVKSLKSGETVYERNGRRLMMPASNMKIVTLAAAADRLGWDYTYETQVFTSGPIEAGTLRGDLVVVGSGDPSLMSADANALFGQWAEALTHAGVRAITGRVIGDDDRFEDNGLGFGWSWDDLPDDYAAGVSALQLNENAVRVAIAPGPAAGDSAGISISPTGSGLAVVSAVTTAAAGTPTAIRTRRLPGSMRLELRGTIAAGASPAALNVSVENPTLFFATALRDALIARGLDVRGPAVDVDDIIDAPPRSATPIATHRSPPLSTLAVRLMKESQNLYAETLLKTLSARAGAPVATAERGRAEAAAALQTWGVNATDLIQRDGSGLSRYDYVTADALVTILMHVGRDERLRGPFEASLPIAGRDGTLANRMKGTPAEGNARAKTGSMSNVRGMSGYVTSAAGEPLVFSILANNFEVPADTINRTTDAIVVRLATFAR